MISGRKKFLLLSFIVFLFPAFSPLAQKNAYWIWYPGEFEIWLHREVSNRRIEKNALNPPFYIVSAPFQTIFFTKEVTLNDDEEVTIKADGKYSVIVDDKFLDGEPDQFTLSKGKHAIKINVVNTTGFPSIYLKGKNINSDSTWNVNNGNLFNYKAAFSDQFTNIQSPPTQFRFPVKEIPALNTTQGSKSILYDFGKETFGYIRLKNISGTGKVSVYYGESAEEALDAANCETYEKFTIPKDSLASFTAPVARAFRYVNVVPIVNISVGNASALFEYNPLTYRGRFKCSNEKLNKIWDVASYTLHLNAREFMLDGIKRDRWVWAGDAVQSFLMNYYLFFDKEINKRTIIGLRGHEPVEMHLNKIVDYSYYWLISIYEYYLYTGDKEFVNFIYPKMVTMMDFCMTRINANGFIQGKNGDWTYIDWANIDNNGEVSTEQLLHARALQALAECGRLTGDKARASKFDEQAKAMIAKTITTFWDPSQGALVHNRVNGELNKKVTRYPNMFALMFGYLDSDKAQKVKNQVLLNDKVQKITTPYMRFYELATLCEIGEYDYVYKEILNYWGGMLDAGATTFWEAYDPAQSGKEHLAFYGRPFGKSLCHAWGASPIYLIGKYYLGAKPLGPGYSKFIIEPNLAGLDFMDGAVPTPNGTIKIYMNKTQIKVYVTEGKGTIRFNSKNVPKVNLGVPVKVGENFYELAIRENNKEYVIDYKQ